MSRNYKEAPQDFLYCQKKQCSQSDACLRFQAGLSIDATLSHFSIVNPLYVEDRAECPYFRSTEPIRCASGITHLFDNLPHAKSHKIKYLISNYFSKGTLYRITIKERLIKPEEIAFIQSLFTKEGITEEPLFDEYVEMFDW